MRAHDDPAKSHQSDRPKHRYRLADRNAALFPYIFDEACQQRGCERGMGAGKGRIRHSRKLRQPPALKRMLRIDLTKTHPLLAKLYEQHDPIANQHQLRIKKDPFTPRFTPCLAHLMRTV